MWEEFYEKWQGVDINIPKPISCSLRYFVETNYLIGLTSGLKIAMIFLQSVFWGSVPFLRFTATSCQLPLAVQWLSLTAMSWPSIQEKTQKCRLANLKYICQLQVAFFLIIKVIPQFKKGEIPLTYPWFKEFKGVIIPHPLQVDQKRELTHR